MHTISIPYKITKGEDVINRKRLGFSACVRNMYRNLAKGELSQKEVIDIAKNKHKLHYGLEEYIFNSAFVEAVTKVKQEKNFDQKIEKRRQDRISENNKRTKIRNEARKEIRDIYKNGAISDSDLKNIASLKDKIKKNKKLNDLKKPKAGRIVFGGKNNLIAHQKRQEKLNKERLYLLLDNSLSNDEIIDKLNDIDNQLKENKNKWKMKRLLPLSIPGNMAKDGGNNFFTFSSDGSICYAKFVRKISGGYSGPSITEEAEFSLNLNSMSNKRRKIFQELIKLGNLKKTPIMVRLNNDTIDITYDPIVLTPCIEQKKRKVKIKKDDSLEVKNLLTKNPLLTKSNFIHPEYHEMNKIYEDRAIGIDLNPEYIGVSVIKYHKPNEINDITIRDANCVEVIDYKQFKIECPISNFNNDYIKELMTQTLSFIAEEITSLARKHKVGKIYFEQSLGNLQGRTNNKKLNGMLNHWARNTFRTILERKCYLIRCDSLVITYHAQDIDGNDVYIKKDGVKYPLKKTRIISKKGIKETDIPSDISGKILSVKLQEKDQCIFITDVFAAYSSVAGNMIDWYEITKKRLPTTQTIYRERLVPDCCGAGIELARRGIVNYFYSQLSPSCCPLFKEEQLISQKKDIIFYNNMKELTYPTNLNSLVSKEQWKTIKDLSANKILKENWNSSGFNWYRNPPSDTKMGVARCYYSCNGAIDLNIIKMIYLSFFIYCK